MNDTTLVIMAAGIGSRYGGGIKQLEHVGPSGEIIMDYSIYDAVKAGFNKVVFIIRKDLEKDFREIIGNRIEKHVKVEYAFQELDKLPQGYTKPEERVKPWGTGHAVLCCKGVVNEPFVVINADDYYGAEGFRKIYDFLNREDIRTAAGRYCMAGFILGNTLSDNGTVTRGICEVDSQNLLRTVNETFELKQSAGEVTGRDINKNEIKVPLDTPVSMNMWGFTPDLFDTLETGFIEFLEGINEGDIKAEYLLPAVVGQLVTAGKASVEVLKTADKWFGVTYKEDKEMVVNSLRELINAGKYPERLFN